MSSECKALYGIYVQFNYSNTIILKLWKAWGKDDEALNWPLYKFVKKYKNERNM